MHNDNKLKLGIFSANCSSGMAVTKIPERWENTWDNNLKLARLCDEAGLEFMLPIARWIGYGGDTDFHGGVLETVTWATGLTAHTRHMQIFATVHTAFNHPVVIAKQLASIDHLGGGRVGLNVVAGWNKPEYDAFGVDLPTEHVERYARAQEWFDFVQKLWHEERAFDWHGDYFQGSGVYSNPRPIQSRIPVLNAAASKEGRQFAMRNADFLFTPVFDFDQARATVEDIGGMSREQGRDVGVFTFSSVVCRPTQKEAEDYLDYYANQNADWEAVDYLMKLQGMHAQSFTPDALARFRDRFAAGHGGFPLVGTPDHVADQLELLSKAGIAGTTLAFVDYAKEFPYFRDEVLPRLERKGLRQPFTGQSFNQGE
ncbi:LLM class flavin-dependent oxidoreductase [Parahaliea mediterranea]|uniref:LLM class flavin-dependent oxidoreductase n=1 Tax=Parahaliea mediterranea TaxID=651086 RepID=A0A939DCE4_9GAMM|nr:LLM class flavin-dependent oxidoreductase [Parahaliea mediterranea]MBN7795576.1 LLM class flavin-dependent oxidoreductase [Parahaliea mediterranea]